MCHRAASCFRLSCSACAAFSAGDGSSLAAIRAAIWSFEGTDPATPYTTTLSVSVSLYFCLSVSLLLSLSISVSLFLLRCTVTKECSSNRQYLTRKARVAAARPQQQHRQPQQQQHRQQPQQQSLRVSDGSKIGKSSVLRGMALHRWCAVWRCTRVIWGLPTG